VLSVLQLNFVLGMLAALVLAVFYRKFLPAHQVGVTVRHLCAVAAGLALGFFCFGK